MITTITGGPGITVSSGSGGLPYINPHPNNPIIGMVRINSGRMEAFDGNNWIGISTAHPSVSLDQDTQDLLQWARAQQTMSLNRITLAQNNPTLMKALENLKRAEDNFELLSEFVKHDKRETA